MHDSQQKTKKYNKYIYTKKKKNRIKGINKLKKQNHRLKSKKTSQV